MRVAIYLLSDLGISEPRHPGEGRECGRTSVLSNPFKGQRLVYIYDSFLWVSSLRLSRHCKPSFPATRRRRCYCRCRERIWFPRQASWLAQGCSATARSSAGLSGKGHIRRTQKLNLFQKCMAPQPVCHTTLRLAGGGSVSVGGAAASVPVYAPDETNAADAKKLAGPNRTPWPT